MVDQLPPPLSPDQISLLMDTLRMIQSRGFGEVRLVIENGIVRFIQPTISMDLRYPEREEYWVRK